MNLLELNVESVCNVMCKKSKQPFEESARTWLAHGSLITYYHYNCCDSDRINDAGWGCGYRTVQSLCSWFATDRDQHAYTLPQIQHALVHTCGDKPVEFLGSREWIGCVEAAYVIDALTNVACRIVHLPAPNPFSQGEGLSTVRLHLVTRASPFMVGGNSDNSSKCILGLAVELHFETKSETDVLDVNKSYFLVLDPHFIASSNQDEENESEEEEEVAEARKSLLLEILIEKGFIRWMRVNELDESGSFYNLCLPQNKK